MNENKDNNIAEIPRQSVIIPIDQLSINESKLLCCNMKTDSKMLSFFVKVMISTFILSFCFFKLHYIEACNCNDDSIVYISIMSSILSFWTGQYVQK